MENEGNAPGANGKSSIENRRAGINSLMTKFNGIDQRTADVKSGINAAQGQVGTTLGNTVRTDGAVTTDAAAVVADPVVTRTEYPKGDAAGAGSTRTTNADGSYSIKTDTGVVINYNKDGTIKGAIQDPNKVLT